jgi:CIC family chloride channel protein
MKFDIYDSFQGIVDKLRLNDSTIMLALASVIGLIGGIGAVGFRTLIGLIQALAIGGSNHIPERVFALPWYHKLLLPSVGGLIIGPLIYYLGKETKGHGVPEVMEAVALRGGRIRSRVMFLKAFVSAVTIGTGGSVGREGPIVQIGSSLGSTIGQSLRLGQDKLRVLVACGAAAGIAATFNAPIAGVMFAVEIIIGNYAILTLVPLIMSSVLATIIGRWYFGDIPAFEIPRYTLSSGWEIGPYILLGLAAGVVAVGFVKLLYALEDLADRPFLGKLKWAKTPLILTIIGVMFLGFPQVYGVGYDTITQVLKGDIAWRILLLLVPIKMLATSITLSAGGSGGIFAPSLFLGAVFGGSFGYLMEYAFPGVVGAPSAYAVVGMSAMVAGTTHAPITAFMVIFEMTADYKLILPLMICSILASFIASALKRDSIYTQKLTRRGVDLSQGMEVTIMQATKVRDVMKTDMVVLNEGERFNDLLQRVINENEVNYYVVDKTRKYQGSFTIHDVKEFLNEKALASLIVAKDIVSSSPRLAVTMDATLADCMKKFGSYETEELPVIDNRESCTLMGTASRRDIINVYNREILRQDSLGLKFIQGKLPAKSPAHSYVDLPEGCETNVIPVTKAMRGKTLKDLNIRQNFNVTVVAINRRGDRGERTVILPSPDEILKIKDMLVVIGDGDALRLIREAYRIPT